MLGVLLLSVSQHARSLFGCLVYPNFHGVSLLCQWEAVPLVADSSPCLLCFTPLKSG